MRVIVRSPDAMDLGLGIRVVRFPGEQCGHHWECRRELTKIRAADVAEIGADRQASLARLNNYRTRTLRGLQS
jgi:hypothetical protein